MNVFRRRMSPVFIKDTSSLERDVLALRDLLQTVNRTETKRKIERDISLIEYGIQGEKNIDFELINSGLPIAIIKDYCIEVEGQKHQIDYLVFTTKLVFVIECKNLFGHIEVNAQGDFTRTLQNGRYREKTGLYSPITQNRRHVRALKNLILSRQKNILTRYQFNRNFDNFCIPVVVIANAQTVLNIRFAKKEMKKEIIKADQLVRFIREKHNASSESALSQKAQLEWARGWLGLHQETACSFINKYKGNAESKKDNHGKKMDLRESRLYLELKKYRLETSRKLSIKAYYIYNNQQMDALIELRPKRIEDLRKLTWFTEQKINEYGSAIIEIFNAVDK